MESVKDNSKTTSVYPETSMDELIQLAEGRDENIVVNTRENLDYYQVFPTLKLAIDDAAKKTLNESSLPVFASDYAVVAGGKKKTTGAKEFIVASYQSFAKKLIQTNALNRNFYETILPSLPCHLHIDAEYFYATNPEAKPAEWMETNMLDRIKRVLAEMKIDTEKMEIIILESSNSRKFSRHYIIKVAGVAFKNNYHCGAFMRRVEMLILADYGSNIEQNPFYLWKEKEIEFKFDKTKLNKTSFMDMTIYNTNRQFRTVGSVKAGERDYNNRVLRPIGSPSTFNSPQDIERILSAMIQRPDNKPRLIECLEIDGSEPKSMGNSVASRNLRSLSKGEILTTMKIAPNTGKGEEENEGQGPSKRFKTNEDFRSSLLDDPDSTLFVDDTEQAGPTYHQLLPLITDDILKKFSHATQLNSLGYNVKDQLISFSCRSKQCIIAQIEHDSNHIYFVVDLKNSRFYQKCKASGCSNKKSSPFPLSKETSEKIKKYMERQDLQLQKNENIKALLKYIDVYDLLDSLIQCE